MTEMSDKEIREEVNKQITNLEDCLKSPHPNAVTLLDLFTIVNNTIESAQNILKPDEIADLRNKFAELSVQILKLIY